MAAKGNEAKELVFQKIKDTIDAYDKLLCYISGIP